MGSLPDPLHPTSISAGLIEDLRSSLKTSKLLTPDSDGYGEKIKRWADSSEKRAVNDPTPSDTLRSR